MLSRSAYLWWAGWSGCWWATQHPVDVGGVDHQQSGYARAMADHVVPARWVGVVWLVAVGLLVSGCGSSAGETAARGVAERFLGAVSSGDGAAACGLLAPQAVRRIESDQGDCVQALVGMGLPGGQVRGVSAWGDAAQVRTTADTLFLRELDSGWRVTAAGCQPQGEAPYECVVEVS